MILCTACKRHLETARDVRVLRSDIIAGSE